MLPLFHGQETSTLPPVNGLSAPTVPRSGNLYPPVSELTLLPLFHGQETSTLPSVNGLSTATVPRSENFSVHSRQLVSSASSKGPLSSHCSTVSKLLCTLPSTRIFSLQQGSSLLPLFHGQQTSLYTPVNSYLQTAAMVLHMESQSTQSHAADKSFSRLSHRRYENRIGVLLLKEVK